MGKNSARRFLYLATMIVIVLILFLQNKYISVCLAIAFSLGAGVFLYKNITLLTDVSEDRVKTRTLKKAVVFCLVMVIIAVVGIVLTEKELFTEYAERMFANVFIIIIIVWFGNIAGKIPFNRYIGLRLPWLLADEETWNIGHRLLEYCSLPLAIIYLGLIPFVNNKNLAICIVALWIIKSTKLPVRYGEMDIIKNVIMIITIRRYDFLFLKNLCNTYLNISNQPY